ncbi:unnamed protein product [Candidula unifasciata]|uniref:Uncharacterized protein n=1 Tax=Candidula unifasciata TaxID=100452 RepID=A0A8S3Z8M8_9EUPU|nr:unnamed protein product [Candidula unifasciata]
MNNLNKVFLCVLVIITLTLRVGALQFSPELADVYAVLNKPLWWTCSVLNTAQTRSVTFIWRFQDADIVKDGTRIAYGNGTLYFPQVLNTHFGKYTCIVSDSQSVIVSSALLQQAYISYSTVLQPNIQSVLLGGTAFLDCKAEGKPAPSLSWTLNGRNINRSSRVLITDLEAGHSMIQINSIVYADAGSYICVVNHVTLTQPISSGSALVRVYGPPVITSNLLDQVVPIGYNATFSCPANSEPKATITWLFTPSNGDGTPQQLSASQPSLYTDDAKGILQLMNVAEDRTGVYSCTWNNQHGSAFSEAKLLVAGNPQPPVFSTRPVDKTLTEGSDLTLSCGGTGNPGVSVVWVGPTGQVITTNLATQNNDSASVYGNSSVQASLGAEQAYAEGNGVLTIRNISRSVRGMYICRLVNSVGTVESVAYVNILYKPYIITPPQSVTVSEGFAFSLPCAAVGNPHPTISWNIPNKPTVNLTSVNSGMNSNSNEVVLDNGDLSIVQASRIHRGLFTCYATNNIGSTAASAIVSVSGVPSFSATPVSQGVIEGDTVVLQCQADAYVDAQVTWYYRYIMDPSIQSTDILQYIKESLSQNNLPTDNMTMLQASESTTFSFINDTSLRFEHVSGGDAGLYLCLATNDHGSAFAAAILRVITIPVFKDTPTDRRVTLGSTVRLDCFPVGIPVPSQRWLFNQRAIEMNPRTVLYINGSLLISNVQESDLGNYTCRAINQAGERSSSAILTVSTLPYFLTAPVNTTTAAGSTAIIPCRGNSPTSFQVVWYLSDVAGNPLRPLDLTVGNQNTASPVSRFQVSSEGDLIFKCVEQSDANWYICVLSNSDGSTPSNPAYLTVDILPSIISTEVAYTLMLGQTGNITCQATGLPLPVVSWLTPVKVEYTEASAGEITVSVEETLQYVNSTLTILSVNMERDAGVWTCKACNEIGCRLQRVTLNLTGNAIIRQLIGQEFDDDYFFSCITAGLPVPNITYSSGGNLITNLTEGHTVVANDLWIRRDKIKSEYTCQIDTVNGSYAKLSSPPGVGILTVNPTSDSLTVLMTHSEPIPYLTPSKFLLRLAADSTNSWKTETFFLSSQLEDYLEVESGAVAGNSTPASCTERSIVKRNANAENTAPKDFTVSINSTGTEWVFSIEAIIRNLTSNTAYLLQASMVNIIGPGPYSPTVSAKTLAAAPSAVSNVTVTVYNRTATVAWKHPDPLNGQPEDTTVTVQLFNSRLDNSAIATVTVSVLQQPLATFQDLKTGDYNLKIFAYNTRTLTTSVVVTEVFQVYDYPPTYKPVIEGIKSLDGHVVQINWTVPLNPSSIFPPVTGYIIDVFTVEDGAVDIHKLQQTVNITGGSVSSKNIDHLQENTIYSLRVASRNSAGIGPYSDSRNVTTPFSEFSEQTFDNDATPWRTVAIVFIVVASSLIILATTLVVVYQIKIAKIRSIKLDSQPESDIPLDNKPEEEMQHDRDSRTVEGYQNDNTILY